MSLATFIEKSAKNFGVELPIVNTSYFQDEQQAFQIQKSSIWPLAHTLLRRLEVVPAEGDYRAFAQVYATVVWVYVGGWVISSSIGNLPFQICRGKKDNPEFVDEGAALDRKSVV